MPDFMALRAELAADPLGLGLVGMSDAAAATALNGNSRPLSVARSIIPSYEIINATDPAEWAALSAQEKQRYQTLTGAGSVDVSSANVRNAFAAMFGAGTVTRAALVALQNQATPRTRAQEIFGAPVTAADVRAARS